MGLPFLRMGFFCAKTTFWTRTLVKLLASDEGEKQTPSACVFFSFPKYVN